MAQILKFFARGKALVYWPGSKVLGQLPRYVGRSWNKADRTHPATKEPAQVDLSTAEGRRTGQRMRRAVWDGSLWPADAFTAQWCGVPFVDVEYRDGVVTEKTSKTSKTPAGNESSGGKG